MEDLGGFFGGVMLKIKRLRKATNHTGIGAEHFLHLGFVSRHNDYHLALKLMYMVCTNEKNM